MKLLIISAFFFSISFHAVSQEALSNGTYLMIGTGTSHKSTRIMEYSDAVFPQFKFGKLYYFGAEGSKSNFAFHWNIADVALQAYKFNYDGPAVEAASRAGITYSIATGKGPIDLSLLVGPTLLVAHNSHEIDDQRFSYTFLGYSVNPGVQWRINNKFIIGSSLSFAQADAGSGDVDFTEINEISSTTFSVTFGLFLEK